MTLPTGSQQSHGPDEDHAQRPAEIGLEAVSARTLFRSLGRCVERGYRESLSGALFEHVTATRGLVLRLYDLTTLYFKAWGAWCFSDWGSFSSLESIGWRPCQQ